MLFKKFHGNGQGLTTTQEGLENLDLYEMMLRIVVSFPHKYEVQCREALNEHIEGDGLPGIKIHDLADAEVPGPIFRNDEGRSGFFHARTSEGKTDGPKDQPKGYGPVEYHVFVSP